MKNGEKNKEQITDTSSPTNTYANSNSYGGGVSVGYSGTFIKAGGTITGYDSDTANGNVVKGRDGAVENNRGHAAYAFISSTNYKRRETTAGPEVYMNSSTSGTEGGW